MLHFGQLTSEQKIHFLALAYKVALADSWVRASEESILHFLTRRIGVELGNLPNPVAVEPMLDLFKERRVSMLVLFELLRLAYSDSEFHANESTMLRDIGRLLGLGDGDFATLKGLARRQAALDREIAKMSQAK